MHRAVTGAWLAVTVLLTCGSAGGRELVPFDVIDRNHDGYLSTGEARPWFGLQQFVGSDRDRDMRLTRGEYEGSNRPRARSPFWPRPAAPLPALGAMVAIQLEPALLATTVGELEGREVEAQDGVRVGRVGQLVRSHRDGELYVTLDITGRRLTLPLEALAPGEQGRLRVLDPGSEVGEWLEAYEPAEYTPITAREARLSELR